MKLGAQPRRKDHVATSHITLLKWMLNLSDYDSYKEEDNISENGDGGKYVFSSNFE